MIKRNKSKAATTLCVCGRKNVVYNTQSKSNMCTISKINGRYMSWTKTYSSFSGNDSTSYSLGWGWEYPD